MGVASVLEESTGLETLGEGCFRIELSPRFANMDGSPNGGYTLAIAMRAAREASGKSHVNTASAHFLRPLATAPCDVTATVLRSGRRFDVVDLRVEQEGQVCLAVLATMGDLGSREGASFDTPMPEFPPLQPVDGPPVDMPLNEHFSLAVPDGHDRFMHGEPLEVPRAVARVGRVGNVSMDELWLPILADWRPPGPWLVGHFGMIPTVEMDLHVLASPPYGEISFEVLMEGMRDGQLIETVRMWDADGRLVATARQLALLVQ